MSRDIGTTPDVSEVADRLAIMEVLAAHSRGLDRLDVDTLTACYWPDAEVDYGSYQGPAHTFAGLVIRALAKQYECTRHSLDPTLCAIDGATARTETQVTAAHLLTGASQEMLFYGRYLDSLERRDGAWKIVHRRVVVDWAKHVPVDDLRDSDAFVAMARGAHHPDDPLYPFLAGEHALRANP